MKTIKPDAAIGLLPSTSQGVLPLLPTGPYKRTIMNPKDLELEIDSLYVDLERAEHNADGEEERRILNLIHKLKAKHCMLLINKEQERCKI